MDLDRLDIYETARLSKLLELLGTPADIKGMESCVHICEAAAICYRKELDKMYANNRSHEGG